MTFGNKRHLVIFHSTSSGLNGADLGSDENEIVFLVYLIIDLETKKVVEVHKYPVRPNTLPPPSSTASPTSFSSPNSTVTTSTNNNDKTKPVSTSPSSDTNINGSAKDSNNGLVSSSNSSLSSSDKPHSSMTSSSSPNESNSTDASASTDENENNNKSSISSTTNSNNTNGTSVGPSMVTFEQIRKEYELTDEVLKNASSLEAVIDRFDSDVARKSLNHNFVLVTDGQLHIRQCLFPEAQRKNIKLPNYYYKFHDLRKEYMAVKPNCSVLTLKDMLNDIENGESENNSEDKSTGDVQDMAKIILKLICDDVKFHEPEVVQTKLEQGIRSQTDKVDTHCCVRARGLPWQASDQDIARFFVGLNVAKGGVALCLSSQGRRNGEALVLFENAAHRDMALSRHKHHIGNRYIEVYKATGEDFINVAGGNNKEAQQFLSRGGQVIIRMRGLPYDATPKQVIEFFGKGDSACQVKDESDGVLFVRKPDGRATGDAFVLFAEEEDSEKALQKHKDIIGSRYIELFRSTTAEVQQVLNRTMENHHGNHRNQQNHQNHRQPLLHHINNINNANSAQQTPPHHNLPLISQMPNAIPSPAASAAVLPQQLITAGTRKDCVRLRGLPYTAQVENIIDFLGEHAKNIAFQGVHMVYNNQGQPSGEAFIQMTHEQAAFSAAQNRHHRYMGYGKKQRYIEVFQCSGEDMNNVLLPPQPSSLAMAAQALAGGGNQGTGSATAGAIDNGVGILGGSNPGAIAAAAVKSPNSAGLLPPGMLNSLQNHPSSIISNGLVGNQLATFPNSQPPPPPTPPSTPGSSSLEQYNSALQNNALLLNQQSLALLGQGASALPSQLGIGNYSLPPPSQSPAAVTSASSISLPSSQGGLPGLLQNIRPPLNSLGASTDANSVAMLQALMANGAPASGTQALMPFGLPGIPSPLLPNGTQSLLGPVANVPGLQFQTAGLGMNGLGGLLLPPTPTSNSALLRLPSSSIPNNVPNAAELAFGNQQNQAALLQSQLAAQKLLLSQGVPNANAGLLPTISLDQGAPGLAIPQMSSSSPMIVSSASTYSGKRAFEQAFSAPPGVAAAVAHAAQAAKRANYSYDSTASQPTISAGPTTYSHAQQPSTNDP